MACNRTGARRTQQVMFRALAALLLCAPLAAQSPAKIYGKVIDAATRQPIPKVHVSSTTGRPGANGQFVGALSGPDGSYTLENVPPGEVSMLLNLEGYHMLVDPPGRGESFHIAAGETLRRDFALHPQARIYGKLMDRDTGEEIGEHTVVSLMKESRPGTTYFMEHAGTQKGGAFEIANLDPGDYLLQIESDAQAAFVFPADASPPPPPKKVYGRSWYPGAAHIEGAVPIHVSEGESRRVEVALRSRETHSLSGLITVPHQFESAPLALALQSSGLKGWVGTMPAPGTFRVDNLAPGNYRLVITGGKPPADAATFRDFVIFGAEQGRSGDRLDEVASYDFEIADNDIGGVRIALQPYASVTSEVRMVEADTAPPPRLGVAMIPAVPDSLLIIRPAPADQKGQFHEQGIRPGEYWPRLLSLPAGYAVARILYQGSPLAGRPVTISGAEARLIFEVTSHPGIVAGIVRDAADNPVGGATVVLLPDTEAANLDPALIQTQQTAADGAFIFRDRAPGFYHALALSDADRDGQGDIEYLRRKASANPAVEVLAGQSARIELKR